MRNVRAVVLAASIPLFSLAGPRLAAAEDLRELGFSVTQATRVITFRERKGGFQSVDELAEVPGMPRDLLDDVGGKLTL